MNVLILQQAEREVQRVQAEREELVERYNDSSHFNREYKSLFGVPPMRDVQRLREEALALPDR